MFSSKIYRDLDSATVVPFRYLEFGPDGELQTPPGGTDSGSGFLPAAAVSAQQAPRDEADARLASAPDQTPAAASPAGPTKAADEALEEAYARGRRDGLAEREQELGRAADALGEALGQISGLRESLLKNSSQDMLNLVLVVAKQVLQTELALNSNVILETIEKALQVAVRADSYHIRVNEADLALVQEKKPLFLARISGLQNITFSTDPDIQRGGCRLESEFGEVDATIESQFEVIRKTLSGIVEEEE